MKLHEAYLCIDCDEIFVANETNPSCPSCNSRSFAPISGWLTSWEAFDRLNARRKPLPVSVALVTDESRACTAVRPHVAPRIEPGAEDLVVRIRRAGM